MKNASRPLYLAAGRGKPLAQEEAENVARAERESSALVSGKIELLIKATRHWKEIYLKESLEQLRYAESALGIHGGAVE